MPYHELLIVPSVGHFGKGCYNPGHSYGYYFEIDIIKQLARDLDEILENRRLRVNTLKLWDAPGVPKDELVKYSSDSTLTLIIGLSARHDLDGGNATEATYSHPSVQKFAELVSEASTDWAKCSNFHHGMAKPRLKTDLFPTPAVRLEPFSLFTSDPGSYLKRMPALAEALAICIMDYMATGQNALRGSPYSAWKNDKLKNDPKPAADSVSVGDFLRKIESGMTEAYLPPSDDDHSENPKPQKKPLKQQSSQVRSHSTDPLAVPGKGRR